MGDRRLELAKRRVGRWSVGLAAAAVVIGGSAAFGAISDNFTSPSAPVPGGSIQISLAMQGARTGALVGMQVLALDLGLASPTAQGGGIGNNVCQGVEFRATTSAATPQLFNAAAGDELITKAVFSESRGLALGRPASPFFTITLNNALITSIHSVAATTTGAYDDVTLKPQRVTLNWTANGPQIGTTSTFNCAAGSDAASPGVATP